LGYSHFYIGDWPEARAALTRTLDYNPDIAVRDEAEYLIAVSLLEEKDYEVAENRLGAVVEKGNNWSRQAIYRLAWLAFDNGDMEVAYDRFGEAAVASRELAPFCAYWQAECLLRTGKEDEGLSQLKYILKEMPESSLADNALFRFSKVLINRGETEDGINNLNSLIARYGESALVDDSAYLIARTRYDGKSYDMALTSYNELIRSYPDSPYVPRAHYDIGMIHYDKGDYRKAKGVFGGVVSKYPDSDVADDALYQSGFCELALRDYDTALSDFERVAKMFSSSPLVDDALYRVEICRYKMGEYSNEIEVAMAYVTKYPASNLCSGLYIKIARYYDKMGKRNEAEEYFLLAEETAGTPETQYETLRYLAEFYVDAGRPEDAIKAYERMLKDGAGYRDEATLYRMAEVAESNGDDAAALSYYSRLINDFPNGEYRSAAMLRSGNKLRKLKMYEESNATLLQYLSEYPDSKNVNIARFYVAFNYQRIGEYGEAIKYHKSVATYGRRSLAVQSYYWLGVCERDIGDREAARSYFSKVINNYRDFPDWVERAEVELTNM
jgi:TolA-binding protein